MNNTSGNLENMKTGHYRDSSYHSRDQSRPKFELKDASTLDFSCDSNSRDERRHKKYKNKHSEMVQKVSKKPQNKYKIDEQLIDLNYMSLGHDRIRQIDHMPSSSSTKNKSVSKTFASSNIFNAYMANFEHF